MADLVSIIIPTFNRFESLKRAIRSAVHQDYPEVEIIVVNDGGDEKSIQKLIIDSKKIKLIHQRINKGVSAARNAGIQAASGDYILFLDDDDELDSSFISGILNKKEQSAEVVIGYAQLKGDDSDRHFQKVKQYCEVLYSLFHKTSPTSWSYFLQYMPAIHSMIFKADLFKSVYFDEQIMYGEDRLLMLHLQQKKVQMQVTECFAGYYYYQKSEYSFDDKFKYIAKSRSIISSHKGQAYIHLLEAYFHYKNSNINSVFRSIIYSIKSPYVVVKQFLLFLRLIMLR